MKIKKNRKKTDRKKEIEKKKLVRLIKFAERSKGLEITEKIKLILFLNKVKPNAEITLKIGSKNLGEKFEFEKKLKEKGVVFSVSKPRSYEEIKKIKGNKVIWEIKGTYYTYDLFKNRKEKDVFRNYLGLLEKGRYKEGDKVAGKHYHYPACCTVRFIKEKKDGFLKKNYSYWQYYKKQQELDQKFPFIFHRPCSLRCKKSLKMNKGYESELKKGSKKIYKEYAGKGKFKGKLIVGGISDVLVEGRSIWPEKKGYEYELIFKKAFRQHYYLVSFLSRKKYERGQILKGEVGLQYDYAKAKILKEKKRIIKGLHHERKLPLLGEVTLQ